MRFWRRRSPGKHALGAAVTGIPSAVLRPAAVAGPVVVASPRAEPPPQAEPPARVDVAHPRVEAPPPPVGPPFSSSARPPVLAPVPAVVAPPLQRQPVAPAFVPSVQLGFRDGTYASLDPSSPHSRALQALARAMTACD